MADERIAATLDESDGINVARHLTVGAAQMGPISSDQTRRQSVERLVALLEDGASRGCALVVFPELALTTFFPRWFSEDQEWIDAWFERSMPNEATEPLFARARELGVGFSLGYAEIADDEDGTRHHYNTQVLVERDGSVVGKYRKVHIPGHAEHEPDRPFQHAERHYFEPGPDGFGVWDAFGATVGMAICNDRRWSETYRVMGLKGAELILIGYNTPLHYDPDPQQNALAGFHNDLVMASGAYQNGAFVVGVAKGGEEEGVDSLAQSAIYAPSGQVVARCITTGDEVAVARLDLDFCSLYRNTVFDFDRYRVPKHYRLIAEEPDGS